MIIALLLFQALLFFLLLFKLPNIIVIAIGILLVICIMIANARWEAIWNEVRELRRELEGLKNTKN